MRAMWIGAMLAGLSGCAEHWYAYDAIEMAFRAPGQIGVRATITPEAWPDNLYEDTVRVTFRAGSMLADDVSVNAVEADAYERAAVTLLRDPDAELKGGVDWVNVMHPWEDCDHAEVCVRELWYAVDCETACDGFLEADAFTATHPWPEPDRGGSLTLEFIEPDRGGGVIAL